MSNEPRILELVQEILDSDRSPEEVCADCPELLWEVEKQWKRVCRVDSQLAAIFPSSDSASAGAERDELAFWIDGDLPKIPGYEVETVLGHGGMGVVYKARHLKLNRPVALKMMIYGACATPHEQARFQREAEAVAGLRHPHIVQVYDVGDANGRPYYTMEFVEGGSLATKLAGKPQPAHVAASCAATLAEAVQAAHSGGIVHRDLSPANVLLTAEGTLKITDFGLARRLKNGAGLTLSGTALGTPGYMAPEQALGQSENIGPSADVYSLGAILYKLLTGRPPFQGETSAATIQQLLADDPVPPSRVNRTVPRDLETICLKCLHKEPQRRYGSAAALAEDLHRFERGEPIAARPIGPMERGLRWLRRRPALGVALAASVLLALTLAGVGAWWHWQQTQTERAVEGELREVVRLQQQSAFREASVALDRAKARLGESGPARMYPILDQARDDLQLLARLDAIRLNRLAFAEGRENHAADVRFNNAQADRDYEEAFRTAGICEPSNDPEVVAARLGASALRAPLVAAFDEWAVCSRNKIRQDWLLKVARRADPDPWRDRVRDTAVWGDKAALSELARTAPVAEQPVSLVLALGECLQVAGGDATALLRRVQKEHPDDFWTNFTLAETIHGEATEGHLDPVQAVVYYQRAIKLRPEAAAVYNDLGLVRYRAFQLNDNARDWGLGAISLYQQALRIDSSFSPAHNNLGLALKVKGNWPEAIPEFQETLRLNPRSATAHFNLGAVLAGMGGLNEAIDHYHQALRFDPDFAQAHNFLGVALVAKGWLDEVNDNYPEGVKTLDKFRGLALNEALAHYLQACHFNPKWVPARNPLRISPPDKSKLNEAIGHYWEAIRIEPQLALAHGALGQAQLASRDFIAAAVATRRSLDLLPSSQKEFRANLELQLQRCGHMIALEGRLPAIVQGTDKPATTDCLDLAELCYVKKHFATAAGLYAEALAATPRLSDDLRAGNRYNAACAAALAGCGSGDDVARLSEPELNGLRKQAREWLWLDLTAWAEKLETGTAADRIQAQKALSQWRDDLDLAGLRDPAALGKLAPTERQKCEAIWRDVNDLIARAEDRGQ